jgi:flagellar protein FliO/FliZ
MSAPLTTGAPASTVGALGSSLLALVIVIALILAMAWLLRRLPGAGFGASGGMKIVASLAVGVKERVMVVAVGEQHLVLGVTAQQITLLTTLDTPLPVDAAKPDFSGVLARFRGNKGGSGG